VIRRVSVCPRRLLRDLSAPVNVAVFIKCFFCLFKAFKIFSSKMPFDPRNVINLLVEDSECYTSTTPSEEEIRMKDIIR